MYFKYVCPFVTTRHESVTRRFCQSVPWKSLFLNFKKIKEEYFKVLEKNNCDIPIEDFVYFLRIPFWATPLRGNFWLCQIFGLKYAKLKGFKKWYQEINPPEKYNQGKRYWDSHSSLPLSPSLQCRVDLVCFRPPRPTNLIQDWKKGERDDIPEETKKLWLHNTIFTSEQIFSTKVYF